MSDGISLEQLARMIGINPDEVTKYADKRINILGVQYSCTDGEAKKALEFCLKRTKPEILLMVSKKCFQGVFTPIGVV